MPEGSIALGGIGCHGMAVFLPERRTLAVNQMGAEGVNWIGQAPYTEVDHIFQNMGDGTYFHSGYLCIRANVAANTNITYKILVNGAVAMTGGQPIEGHPAPVDPLQRDHEGPLGRRRLRAARRHVGGQDEEGLEEGDGEGPGGGGAVVEPNGV